MDAWTEVSAPRGCWDLGPFLLDLDRAELVGAEGAVIPLRPKTFALLEHLAGQAGRVVSRDTLLDAVWPGVTVTDESLSQAVAELRQALGDAGRHLIRTVPRRGYLLDAAPKRVVRGAARGDGMVLAKRPSGTDMAGAPQGAEHLLPVDSGGPFGGQALRLATPPPAPARLGLPLRRALLAAGVLGLLVSGGFAAVLLGLFAPPPVSAPTPAPDSPRAAAERLLREAYRLAYPPVGSAPDPLAARTLFERAIAADPTHAPAYAGAANTHVRMVLSGESLDPAEDTRRATALAERATRLAPAHATTLAARGDVLRLQGRYAEALEAYQAAVAGDRGMHGARAAAGWMLVLLGRPAEAIETVRTSLALAGNDDSRSGLWTTYVGFAELYAGAGDLGVEELRRSLRHGSAPQIDVRQLHLAAALALSGRIEEARAVAADALARSPGLSVSWLRNRPFSEHPDHLVQREPVLRGLALAGVPE